MAIPVAPAAKLKFCSLSLKEYIEFCCTGRIPSRLVSILEQGGFLADLLCAASVIGALEPLCATRPGVCDPVIFVDKQIFVPPATVGPDGIVIPSEVRAISYCAPMNRALVVAESRVEAVNLTAATQPVPQPVYKRVNLGTFGEWCLPFEPLSQPGLISNVEHVIVPPEAGYSVYVQNFNTSSEAAYRLKSRMWACC